MIKILKKILKISEIIINITMSIVLGCLAFMIDYVVFYLLFIKSDTDLIGFPLWFKISLFILLHIVWGITSYQWYKEEKTRNKIIKLMKGK